MTSSLPLSADGRLPKYGATDAQPDLENAENWWDRKVVSKEERMWINGETEAQMAYAEAVSRGREGGVSLNPADGSDTSIDQKWEYEDKPYTDTYVLMTTVLWMGCKLPIFLPLMLIFSFVPTLVCRFYISMLPDNTDRIPRSRCFYIWFWVTLILSIPAIVVIIISYLLDTIAYYLFSLPYCILLCRYSEACAGFEKIAPFRGGPSIVWNAPDIFICVMGQSMRQGLFENNYMVSMMWVLMPWLKYYICCNPYIYNIDHRLVQQISTSMQDLGTPDEVAEECRDIISMARQPQHKAHRIDLWSFVPHYPYPPADRRWAIGMQAGGSGYPAKFTLLVHSTHADAKLGTSCVRTRQSPHSGSQEQFVLSNSIARPVYRVMLWYSNPFHFLTGWVEASISEGKPSQPKKLYGGEHPMWLVSGRTALTSGRDSFTGSGLIDSFFDYWLPVFVHEVRYSMLRARYSAQGHPRQEAQDLALDKANEMYQEVDSKDGISQPRQLLGRDHYQGQDTLTAYQVAGEKQHKQKFQKLDDWMKSANATSFGETAAAYLTAEDLHEQKMNPDKSETPKESESLTASKKPSGQS